MQLINAGEYTQFGRVFGSKIYLYIGGIFVLTAIGFWIQSYMVPENPEAKKDETPKTGEEAKTTAEIDKKEVKKDGDEKPDVNKTTSANTESQSNEKKEEAKNEDKKPEHTDKI